MQLFGYYLSWATLNFWLAIGSGLSVLIWLSWATYDHVNHVIQRAEGRFVYRSDDRQNMKRINDEYEAYGTTGLIMIVLFICLLGLAPKFTWTHWGGTVYLLFALILPWAYMDNDRRYLKLLHGDYRQY